jgi:CDP-diacylglycerol--serine O-phosphatidyltransferase
MMIYMLVLRSMGKIGAAIAVFFVLCSGMRLARFNVKAAKGTVVNYFEGLPTPASAGVLISFVLSYELLGPTGTGLNFRTIPLLMQNMPTFFKLMPIVMVALSFLMVSNVPYYSFKHMELSKPKAVQLLVFIVVLAILIIVFPQNIFFLIFSLYALSGFAVLMTHIIKHRTHRGFVHAKDDDDDDEDT